MKNKKIKLLGISVLLLLALTLFVRADGWTASQPSHSTLYSDTLTSKTDASPVSIADSQGLFVTGDITTLGKVGIGTTNPQSLLQVGDAPTGSSEITEYFSSIGKDLTNPATIDGIYEILTVSPTFTQNTDKNTYLVGVSPEFKTQGAGNIAGVAGVYSAPSYIGSGNLGDGIYGFYSGGGMSSGSAGNIMGLQIFNGISGTAQVDSYTGINIGTTQISGSATAANVYGLKIEDQAGGGTSNYAIKTGLGIVSFGDKVGIGTANPGSTLEVNGETKITGISGDGSGKAVCVKADGNLGTCSSAVGAAGTCTCG